MIRTTRETGKTRTLMGECCCCVVAVVFSGSFRALSWFRFLAWLDNACVSHPRLAILPQVSTSDFTFVQIQAFACISTPNIYIFSLFSHKSDSGGPALTRSCILLPLCPKNVDFCFFMRCVTRYCLIFPALHQSSSRS